MKKILLITAITFMIIGNVLAGKSDMEQAAKTIPGVGDAAFQGSTSFWVVMTNPNAGHDFDYYRQKILGQMSRYMSHTGG